MITALVLMPLIGVVLIPFLPEKTAKYAALAASLGTFGLALALYAQYAAGTAPAANGFAFYESLPWLTSATMDVKYTVGMDGISIFLVLLSTLMFPLAIWSGFKSVQGREKFFYALMLVLQTGTIGFFVSLDLLLMYVFFEMVLIPLYFLVGIWGGQQKAAASLKFFLYTLAGSLVMLVGILYAGAHAVEGTFTTDFFRLREAGFTTEIQGWLFAAFALSFGIKTPIFPLHTWQAQTYAESPTPATVVMAALLSKMGTYGLLRFTVELFPQAAQSWAPVMATLGVIGIIYGGILAAVQTDLKKIIAYSSLSHLGFIVLGIFAFTTEAASGAVFQMVAHGLSTGAIFLLLGMMYDRRGTNDRDAYRGLAKPMPIFAFFMVFSVLASAGLPGLSGFIGEFLIMIGAYNSAVIGGVFAILAAVGVVVAAIYLLIMVRRTMFGEWNAEQTAPIQDMSTREIGILLPLAILMLALGLYATPLQKHINPATDRIVNGIAGEQAPAGVAQR